MNWPISCGVTFKGVYDRRERAIHAFDDAHRGRNRLAAIACDISDTEKLDELIGENLREEKYGKYISAVIVGPYDMSVAVGTPCDIKSPEMTSAIQQVFDICKKYGKSTGIFCDDEELAKKHRKMGANVLWMATDRDYFVRGVNAFLDGVKDI